jgi:hypothetical protein
MFQVAIFMWPISTGPRTGVKGGGALTRLGDPDAGASQVGAHGFQPRDFN